MRRVEERLRGHLVEDESVLADTWGRLLGTGSDVRGRALVGLTDRRLLAVSTAGEFLTVRYEYVCSIRRRERTRVRYRSGDGPNRTARLASGLLALASLVAVAVAATTVGGGQALITTAVAAVTAAVAAFVQSLRTRSGVGRAAEQIAVGAGVLALLALFGAALLAASVSVPLYVLVTAGGHVLADYAATYRDELGGFGLERHRESLLAVNTVDGETLRIAVDADSTIDRDLAAAVHRTDPAPAEVPVVQPPTNRSADGDGSATVRST